MAPLHTGRTWFVALTLGFSLSLTAIEAQTPAVHKPSAWSADNERPNNAVDPTIKNVDNGDVLRTLYDLKSDGWSGTPLNIESLQTSNTTKAMSQHDALPDVMQPDNEHCQLLKEFGAVESGQRTFWRGQRRIAVTVYRFATPEGAYGAYLSLRQGSSTLVLKGDATSQDDKSVSFWKDRYFVTVVGAPDDEESTLVVTGFAGTLAGAIKTSSREPQTLNRIPSLERVRGSEKIVMGPIGIRRFFPAPFASALCLERVLTGVVADYRMQEPDRERVKLLLLTYISPESANKAYTNYLGAIEEQHKPQSFDNYVPQSNLFKVSGSFLLVQLKTDEVLVITGARKKSSLPTLSRSVY